MTTTDTDALTERIAQAMCRHHKLNPLLCDGCKKNLEDAAAVLPIVAAEVRKAKAEALREAAEDLFYDGDNDRPMYGCHALYDRADRIETGDQR